MAISLVRLSRTALTFASGAATLAGNNSGNVDVTIAGASTLARSGERTLPGDLVANGTLDFDLGADSLAIKRDTVLGGTSVINIRTTNPALPIGTAINVITETGSFTNNGTTVNVVDDDFLVDYDVVLGSVVVTPTATNLAAVSADANIDSFGNAITSAVTNKRLSTDVFNSLNGSSNAAAFEANALGLLPAINNGVAREIYETQRFASSLLTNRLSGEATGLWGQAFYRTSDQDSANLSSVGFDGDALGFTLGLDKDLSESATVGVLFNYADIDVDSNGLAAAQSDISSFQLSAYAGLNFDKADRKSVV